jgi:hypothetical protein
MEKMAQVGINNDRLDNIQFFKGVSVALLIGMLASFVFEAHFLLTSTETDGVVKELTAGRSHTRVEFIADGKIIEYQQNGIIRYDIGEKVRVLYKKENPRRASTKSIGALWPWTIAFAILASGFSFSNWIASRYPNLIKSRK